MQDDYCEYEEQADAGGEPFWRHVDGFDGEFCGARYEAAGCGEWAVSGEFGGGAEGEIEEEEEDDPRVGGEEVGRHEDKDEEGGEADPGFGGGERCGGGGGAVGHGAKVGVFCDSLVGWWTSCRGRAVGGG